jgi:glycosyltransferase involved in cell wall biosynthesis
VFILHLHNPVLAFLVAMLKIANPRLHIIMTQRNDWRFFKPHQKLGLRLMARLSDGYVLCGRSLQRTMPSRVYKVLERDNRLHTVPNGINPRQLEPYGRVGAHAIAGEEPDKEAGSTTAVVVARMVPQKNCKFILRLLKEVTMIDRMIWFGDGPERAEVEYEIERTTVYPHFGATEIERVRSAGHPADFFRDEDDLLGEDVIGGTEYIYRVRGKNTHGWGPWGALRLMGTD